MLCRLCGNELDPSLFIQTSKGGICGNELDPFIQTSRITQPLINIELVSSILAHDNYEQYSVNLRDTIIILKHLLVSSIINGSPLIEQNTIKGLKNLFKRPLDISLMVFAQECNYKSTSLEIDLPIHREKQITLINGYVKEQQNCIQIIIPMIISNQIIIYYTGLIDARGRQQTFDVNVIRILINSLQQHPHDTIYAIKDFIRNIRDETFFYENNQERGTMYFSYSVHFESNMWSPF